MSSIVFEAVAVFNIMLMLFAGIKWGDENKRYITLLGNATSVGGKYTEATTASDAILLIVKFNGPVGVRAFF